MSGDRTSGNEQLAAMVAARQARQASSQSTSAAGGGDSEQLGACLLMRMGERWCALRAETVREVVAVESITAVPAQQPHVLGIMLVHGRLVPVVDMCRLVQKLDMALTTTPGRRLIVISIDDTEVGIVADDAKGVIQLLGVDDVERGSRARGDDIIRGELQWEDKLVAFLDAHRLLEAALGAGPT